MIYLPKLTFIANGNNPIGIGLSLGETIYFGSLKFITDRFSNLSLFSKGNDSGTIFIGMVYNGSPSLQTILEEASDEGDAASGGGGALDSPAFTSATW
jgi:hypothetical protein